jgi:hypothetical protein
MPLYDDNMIALKRERAKKKYKGAEKGERDEGTKLMGLQAVYVEIFELATSRTTLSHVVLPFSNVQWLEWQRRAAVHAYSSLPSFLGS